MIKLVFYRGPGDLITKTIRLLTDGPYSHVELQFDNGVRFFSSGHGLIKGTNMTMDSKEFGKQWDAIFIPTTPDEDIEVEAFAFRLVGFPFDWRGLLSFVFSWFDREDSQNKFCSAVVLDVLQKGLHMFPGVSLKISPNGLYRLFLNDPTHQIG